MGHFYKKITTIKKIITIKKDLQLYKNYNHKKVFLATIKKLSSQL